MLIDAQNRVSTAQAVTSTAVSADTVDLSNAAIKRAIGAGTAMTMVVTVNVTAVSTGTYVLEVIQSANANLSSPDVLSSRTIAATSLLAGTAWDVGIPINAVTKQYLGARYTTGGTSPGITVTTDIMPQEDVQAYLSYAKGYTIS